MKILCITGAGLSVGSGLPTYRGAEGRYTEIEAQYKMPVEMVVSNKTLNSQPELLWKYWINMHGQFAKVSPSIGHQALKRLSEAFPDYLEVTQNVDGLSLAAGTDPAKVIQLHGSARRYICQKCNAEHHLSLSLDMHLPPRCYRCREPEGVVIRPDVVLFGEMIDETKLNRALDFASKATVVIVTGTTLAFPYLIAILSAAVSAGAKVVFIDPEAAKDYCMFYLAPNQQQIVESTTAIQESADEALSRLVPALIQGDRMALEGFGL